jgi:hypothetical protein
VDLKQLINAGLRRTTGYQLQRPVQGRRGRPAVHPGDRLLEAPAFILCTVRSGSTLLRVLLDSHPQIHSPHELHLRYISVAVDRDFADKALVEIGLDATHLRYLLWDRLLHRELAASGKQLLVNKTPSDVFIADEIRTCWPDARFIFLLRNPAAIARSRQAARPQDSAARNAEMVLRYGRALEQARRRHAGLTIRYEDLAADPAATTQAVCAFLGVPWNARMLDYGSSGHGSFRPGLGDWSDKIKSGRIHPPESPPALDEVPAELRELARDWGYLGADALTSPMA